MVKALVYFVNAKKSCIQQAYTVTVYAARDGRFSFVFFCLRYGPYFPKDCNFFLENIINIHENANSSLDPHSG